MKELTRASIIRELLEAEYGTDLLDELSRPFLTRQQAINNSVKMSKMKKKFQERMTTFRLLLTSMLLGLTKYHAKSSLSD